jgi:hypothetical protein
MLPAPKVHEGAAPLPTARGRRRSLLLPPNTCFAAPKRPRNRKGKFPPSSLRSWLCSVGRRRLFQRHGGSDVWPVPTSQRAWSRVHRCWLFPSPVRGALFKPTIRWHGVRGASSHALGRVALVRGGGVKPIP